jgi:hypothetical protein
MTIMKSSTFTNWIAPTRKMMSRSDTTRAGTLASAGFSEEITA